jgi:hypothetical protein
MGSSGGCTGWMVVVVVVVVEVVIVGGGRLLFLLVVVVVVVVVLVLSPVLLVPFNVCMYVQYGVYCIRNSYQKVSPVDGSPFLGLYISPYLVIPLCLGCCLLPSSTTMNLVVIINFLYLLLPHGPSF